MLKLIIGVFVFFIMSHSAKGQVSFDLIKQYPSIKDTAAFIKKLKQTCQLQVWGTPEQSITYYKKIKLNGSNKEYILLEYDYNDGPMSSSPWKYQLLFTREGKLIKTFDARRFQLLNVFPKQNPYLLIVISTSKGNGGHELYRLHADILQNVYDGIDDYRFRTYDAHQDNSINEPTELSIKINDNNHDGYNDLVFQGSLVLLQEPDKYGNWYDVKEPYRRIPVKYIFIYDKRTGHFKAKENYIKKYKQYFY